MDLQLSGKTALVLGGTRGLGWACAQALSEAGVKVVLNGRDAAHGEAAAASLPQASFVAGDIGSETARAALMAAVSQRGMPDIVVTNAGGPPAAPFEETSVTQWRVAYETSVLGPLEIVRQCLPAMRAAEITRQAAEGLSVAHEMGIVHRDLKPDNIMLAKNRDGSDCVKVVDFGIAKAASNEAQKVTRTGMVVGTPEYMSPEQLAGDPLDGRSDVYSLALVAFHMLTGTLPFPSETAQEAMIMRLTDRPRTLAEMKPDVTWTPKVQQVMDRALERDAKARYQTASEFGRALDAAVREMPSSAEGSASTLLMGAVTGTVPKTRLAPAEPAPSGTGLLMQRPNRARVAMAAGVVGTLLLGGAVYATQRDRSTVVQGDSTAAARAMTDSMPTGASSPVAPPLQTSESPTDSVTVRPAGGLAGVAPTSSRSYAGELHSLWESAADPESARQAEQRLGRYRGSVRTRADVAAVALIDAKAALLTGGAKRGCGIMRRIDAAALSNKMRQELLEALATCESP